jgi:hypothetical protein
MEGKKADQEHQTNLEKFKAEQASKQQEQMAKQQQKKPLKKSLNGSEAEEDSESLEIEIAWKNY